MGRTISDARLEVFMMVETEFMVFWVAAPCSVVDRYQCFRGPCCFHVWGVTTQKTTNSTTSGFELR
jgi:hypothetical protein